MFRIGAYKFGFSFARDFPPECPDPVKLIRRICALERTVTDLAGECEQIDRRRNAIAPDVIVTQQENIAFIQEVSPHLEIVRMCVFVFRSG